MNYNNLKEIYEIEHFKALKKIASGVSSSGITSKLKSGAKAVGSGAKEAGSKAYSIAKKNPGKALLVAGGAGAAAYVAHDAISDKVNLNGSQFNISTITPLNDKSYTINFLNPDNKEILKGDTIQLQNSSNNIIGGPYTVNKSDLTNITVTILDYDSTKDYKFFILHTTLMNQLGDTTLDTVKMGSTTLGQGAGAVIGGAVDGLSDTMGTDISTILKTLGIATAIIIVILAVAYAIYFFIFKKTPNNNQFYPNNNQFYPNNNQFNPNNNQFYPNNNQFYPNNNQFNPNNNQFYPNNNQFYPNNNQFNPNNNQFNPNNNQFNSNNNQLRP